MIVRIADNGRESAQIQKVLEELFIPLPAVIHLPNRTLQSRADAIYQILVGSLRTYRNGRAPSNAGRISITERIKDSILAGVPIEGLALWSGDKLYGMAEGGADLADVLAFRRIARINAAIQELHPPGILFRIVMENLSAQFDGTTKDKCEQYGSDYRALAKIILPQHIRVQSEEELFTNLGISPDEFSRLSRINYSLFQEYWAESEARGIESFENLPSYKNLHAQGWTGSIPKPLRDHFRLRLQNNGVTERVDDILCKFFACVLLRYQTRGFFAGSFQNTSGGNIPPLRFSFAPFPPHVPANLYEARISYRLMDKTSGKPYRMPPWACCGMLRAVNDLAIDVDLLGLNTFRQVRGKCRVFSAQIAEGGESLSLTTHFLPA